MAAAWSYPMTGDKAVTIITDRSMLSVSLARFSVVPSTMNWRKWSHMSAMISAECR